MLRACLFVGVPVSVLGMLAEAAVLTIPDLPQQLYPAAAAFPVLCGCFAAGYAAGRRRRANGIGTGTVTALLLTALWYAAALCLTEHAGKPVLLFAAIPSGMCGGICGVNAALPLPHGRMHGLQRIRIRAAMFPLLLHRPEQQNRHDSTTNEKNIQYHEKRT